MLHTIMLYAIVIAVLVAFVFVIGLVLPGVRSVFLLIGFIAVVSHVSDGLSRYFHVSGGVAVFLALIVVISVLTLLLWLAGKMVDGRRSTIDNAEKTQSSGVGLDHCHDTP